MLYLTIYPRLVKITFSIFFLKSINECNFLQGLLGPEGRFGIIGAKGAKVRTKMAMSSWSGTGFRTLRTSLLNAVESISAKQPLEYERLELKCATSLSLVMNFVF